MDYRKLGKTIYVRMDKDDEIISSLISICEEHGIESAIFSGIGGCASAEIQTFIPERGEFETQVIEGMLELVSINGSIVREDDGGYTHHTHGMFAYKDGDKHKLSGGHLKSTTVLYTGEIELRPVVGGRIYKKFNPETGTSFWDFRD